jgi:hypothetical protein
VLSVKKDPGEAIAVGIIHPRISPHLIATRIAGTGVATSKVQIKINRKQTPSIINRIMNDKIVLALPLGVLDYPHCCYRLNHLGDIKMFVSKSDEIITLQSSERLYECA